MPKHKNDIAEDVANKSDSVEFKYDKVIPASLFNAITAHFTPTNKHIINCITDFYI